MTKAELITQVSQEAGLTRDQAKKSVESVISSITRTLKKDKRIMVYGLGVFDVVKRPKRKGRNPQSGETLIIKARNVVKFKPSKALKDSVNTGK
ncbi:MAG: HU family DNA-binding protein [Deltaproteobacteria bacterium]|jgi:DNA-binding protein HU-beta|nr:HU family DNA-binding protein [Deltaproteobacteria bacterium]